MLIIHMLVAMYIYMYIDCANGGTSHAGLNSYNIVNWDHHDQYGRIHNLVRPASSQVRKVTGANATSDVWETFWNSTALNSEVHRFER